MEPASEYSSVRRFNSKRFIIDNDEGNKEKKKTKTDKKLLAVWIFFFISFALAIGLGTYFFLQYNQLKSKPYDQNQSIEDQKKVVLDNLSKIVLVKPSEDFIISTIKNADKLREANPDFYADAQVGQLLLVSNKRAIIYDKDSNKIINMSALVNNISTTPTK